MLVASVIWIAVFKCGVKIDYFHAKKNIAKDKKLQKEDEQNRQGTLKRNEEKNRTQIWLTRSIGKEDASRREKK